MHLCTSKDNLPCTMVVFGASGDLTRRKLLPALFALETDNLLPDEFRLVGFSRSQKTDEQWREETRQDLATRLDAPPTAAQWARFGRRLHYVAGQYADPAALTRLHAKIRGISASAMPCSCIFYMAVPPSVSEGILGVLRQTPFAPPDGALFAQRILMEKPFGVNLSTARELNRLLSTLFDESHIYRIDHYLAKDTVRNLMVFRFGNAIFEPLWNRHYIDHVQITAAESLGIEGRGGYYEEAGVVRDMIQNHVLQVLALVAMEPPLAGDDESVRDRKVEVFKSLRPAIMQDVVFGQYSGYRQEHGVAPGSLTPTFAALRLFIDNWRWEGVPFYVRSGKALDCKLTEVVIRFRTVPLCILSSKQACANLRPNVLFLRIQPEEGIRLSFNAQAPGTSDTVGQADLQFRYADFGPVGIESYARVILDALNSRPGLFWRSDGVEAAWRFVEPMLAAERGVLPGVYPNYIVGSRGPEGADALLRRDGRSWLRQNAPV